MDFPAVRRIEDRENEIGIFFNETVIKKQMMPIFYSRTILIYILLVDWDVLSQSRNYFHFKYSDQYHSFSIFTGLSQFCFSND